jgi:DNA-binding NtrC family response regulator
MITGKPSIESASEAVRLGAYDYLIKPVEKDALLKIAEQAIKYKTILDEKDRIYFRQRSGGHRHGGFTDAGDEGQQSF